MSEENKFDPETFDLEGFMNEGAGGELDTEFQVVPAGEYAAIVEHVGNTDGLPDIKQKKDGSGSFVTLDITWSVQDDAVKAALGRDKVTVRQSFILDMKGNSLDYSKGKNVRLGQLKQALGINQPGLPLRALQGAGPALIVVAHREYNGNTYAEVKKVGKLA
jgi:hypothetical protein